MGGALPKICPRRHNNTVARLLTLVALATTGSACDLPAREFGQLESKAHSITIPNLNAAALTIDTNGYMGDICIDDLGCYLGGVKDRPFTLAPRAQAYTILSYYSHAREDGTNHVIGKITVNAQGRATVDTDHFDPVDETTIRARTRPIPINTNGHPLSFHFDGSGIPVTTTTPRLIINRAYPIAENESLSATADNLAFAGRLLIDANGNVSLDQGTDPALSWDGSTLHVRTEEVTIDYRGYAGVLGFGKTWSPGPIGKFRLIPGRRYHMFDRHSADVSTGHTAFVPTALRATVINGSLHLVDGLQPYFDHSPADRRITPVLATLELSSTAPACVGLATPACASPNGPPTIIPVIKGRSYHLREGRTWIKVDATGACSPTTVDVPGGRATIRCRDQAPPSLSCAGPAPGLRCDDLNPCTTDRCDQSTGQCVHTPDASMDGRTCGGTGCEARACQLGVCRTNPFPTDPSCRASAADITPELACVVQRDTTQFTAVFGYRNRRNENILVKPSAQDNFVSPGDADQGQPAWFKAHVGAPGTWTNRAAFAVDFGAGSTVRWTVGGRFAEGSAAQLGGCTLSSTGSDAEAVTFPDETAARLLMNRLLPANALRDARLPTDVVEGTRETPGILRGNFQVSHDGAATYALPLRVPVGRRGIQPNLSLNYHSRGGNGILGIGWSLGGLSEIRTCKHNFRIDKKVEYVAFDGRSPLCLDGQRLIEVTDFDGGDLPPSRRAGEGEREYRTELTTGDRIVARGPRDHEGNFRWFDVETRDGRYLTYGRPLPPPGTVTPPPDPSRPTSPETVGRPKAWHGQRIPAAWPLTQVRDRFGNFMELVYEVDERDVAGMTTYEHRIKEIRYTGRQHPSFGTTDAPRRSIRFEYEERSASEQVPESQWGSIYWRTNKRLRRVEAWAPSPDGAATIAVRYYAVEYEDVFTEQNFKSRVAKIYECEPGANRSIEGPNAQGSDDICLAPINFNWSTSRLDFETIDTGITDVIANNDPDGPGAFGTANLTVADVDGDGYDDLVYPVFSGRDPTYKIAFSRSGGDRLPGLGDRFRGANSPFEFRANGNIQHLKSYLNRFAAAHPMFVDLDSDGKAEIFLPFKTKDEHRVWHTPSSGSQQSVRIEYQDQRFSTVMASWDRAKGAIEFVDAPTWTTPEFPATPPAVTILGKTVRPVHEPYYLGNVILLPLNRFGGPLRSLAVAWGDARLGHPLAFPEFSTHDPTCTYDEDTGENRDCKGGYSWQTFLATAFDRSVTQLLPPDATRLTNDFDVRLTGATAVDEFGMGVQRVGRDELRADLNGDGVPETLRLKDPPDDTMEVLINDERQKFVITLPDRLKGVVDRHNLRPVDLDGDGRQELVYVAARDAKAPLDRPGNMTAYRLVGQSLVEVSLGVPVGHFAAGPAGYLSMHGGCGWPTFLEPRSDLSVKCPNAYSNSMCYPQVPNSRGAHDCLILGGVEPTPGAFKTSTQYRTTQPLDWNGDGLSDFVTVTPDAQRRLMLHVQRSTLNDVLVGIHDDSGFRIGITYAPTSDPGTHPEVDEKRFKIPEDPCPKPNPSCRVRGIWSVVRVAQDTGSTKPMGMNIYHSYGAPRMDPAGRGWLGFSEHTVSWYADFVSEAESRHPTKVLVKTKTKMGLGPPPDLSGIVQFEYARIPQETLTVVRSLSSPEPLTGFRTRVLEFETKRGVPGTPSGTNQPIHFVNLRRVEREEREGGNAAALPMDLAFEQTPTKSRSTRQVVTDAYGNPEVVTDTVEQQDAPTAPLRRIWRSTVTTTYHGEGSSFSLARHLGLKASVRYQSQYRHKPERRRLDRYPAPSLVVGTNDQVDVAVDQPDRDAQSTIIQHRNVYGLVREVEVKALQAGTMTSRRVSTTYDALESIYPQKTSNDLALDETTLFLPGLDVPVWSQDANEVVLRSRYDGFGRLKRVRGAAELEINTSYSRAQGAPLVVTTTGPHGGERVAYDRMGRELKSATRPGSGRWEEAELERSYDPLGRLELVRGPGLGLELRYDARGRPKTELVDQDAGPGGQPREPFKTTYEYDYFLTTVSTDSGAQSKVLGDALGLVQWKEERKDASGGVVTSTFSWEAPGLLEQVTHPGGSETTALYDVLGRRTKLTTPDTGLTQTYYNGFGDVRLRIDAANRHRVTEDYDPLGRLRAQVDEVSGRSLRTEFQYDSAPNGKGALAMDSSPDGIVTRYAYEAQFGAQRDHTPRSRGSRPAGHDPRPRPEGPRARHHLSRRGPRQQRAPEAPVRLQRVHGRSRDGHEPGHWNGTLDGA